jgi:signal transduction histidine kinase
MMKMDPALRTSTARAAAQRMRFEVLRRRIFGELEQGSARWRLRWLMPWQIFIVGLLAYEGEPRSRVVVQACAVAVSTVAFTLKARANYGWLRIASFPLGMTTYFILVATTGGLASPLLIMGAMMLSSAAFAHDPRWMRPGVFAVFLVGLLGLALLAPTVVGQPPALLVSTAGVTPVFWALALTSTMLVMVGVYRMGCTMTQGYERAALELAERREEVCSGGEDRSRELEGLAARLAHEVKNPLAAIKGLSTHMARSAADAKTAERLAIVAAEADRLQSIVDGFLSFSRGLDDLSVAPVKPREVAHELEVLLETRASEAGVALQVTGDEDLVVDADARKLRQALLNLVLNAVQASPRGSTVFVSVARECMGVRLTVHDDGVGMTPEVLERIRKPYFTTKDGGSGLGVAVARGIVEQHGGQLEIKSAAGTGTTASILLPMKAKACAKLPNPLRASEGEGVSDAKVVSGARARAPAGGVP